MSKEIEFWIEGPNASIIAAELADFLHVRFGFKPDAPVDRHASSCGRDALVCDAWTLDAAALLFPLFLLQSPDLEELTALTEKVEALILWAGRKRLEDPQTAITVTIPGSPRQELISLQADRFIHRVNMP